jgi:hypothetical protein
VTVAPWKDPLQRETWVASPGGRMVVTLDEEATKEIATNHRGRAAGPRYILITYEGELRRAKTPRVRDFQEGPHWTEDWDSAKRLMFSETLVTYNSRSKRACRPVWAARLPVLDRQIHNSYWEQVRLIPHQPTLDRYYPNLNTARLFAVE